MISEFMKNELIKVLTGCIVMLTFLTMGLCTCGIAQTTPHWPLRISTQGKYLEDQNGIPFPIIGDAGWSAIVQLNHADLTTYLNDRTAKGFTAIIMNAIEHYFSTNPPYDIYGNPPFTNGMNDWSIRNDAYWSNVDYVLNEAKNRGLVVFLYPAYLGARCGSEGWCTNMQAQTNNAMTNYGNWLGNRYKNQGNIIWVNASDARAQDYPPAYDRVVALANGIKATDTNHHLHSAQSKPEDSAMDDYLAIIDINCTYSYADPKGKIQNDYQRSGALPFYFTESAYEGEGASIGDTQSQAFIAYLGGALLGHFFGNNPIYKFSGAWKNSLNSSGSTSMGYIGKLVKSRAWFRLVPDYSDIVVTSNKGPGVRDYKATARTSDGETILVWNPSTTQVTVDMTKVSGSNVKCWWWKPDDNSSTLIGTYANTGTRNFTPPNARLVLVLDDASKGLAAPGTTIYSSTDKVPPSSPTHLRIISP
jgi:hypothetical protein